MLVMSPPVLRLSPRTGPVEQEKSTPDVARLSTSRLQKETSITPEKSSSIPLYEKDLVRMMAEVNFINGEVHVLYIL